MKNCKREFTKMSELNKHEDEHRLRGEKFGLTNDQKKSYYKEKKSYYIDKYNMSSQKESKVSFEYFMLKFKENPQDWEGSDDSREMN